MAPMPTTCSSRANIPEGRQKIQLLLSMDRALPPPRIAKPIAMVSNVKSDTLWIRDNRDQGSISTCRA